MWVRSPVLWLALLAVPRAAHAEASAPKAVEESSTKEASAPKAVEEPITDEDGRKFLMENKQREGVVTTKSGLQYEVLRNGPADGKQPQLKWKCVCHYKGALLNGTEFDSSHKRGGPATFRPLQVVKGWREALMLMRAGDMWRLWLPAELGYGKKGAGSRIPGGAVLTFELELLEVRESDTSTVRWFQELLVEKPFMLLCLVAGLGYVLWTVTHGGAGRAGLCLPLEAAIGKPGNKKVYMDMKIGDAAPERVEFELFAEFCPKTCENFRALCTGECGVGKLGKPLTYKGCKFHRVIPGFMCQGGDFTNGNGSGGESIFGEQFKDEWVDGHLGHEEPFLLSMANCGPNTNGSQFFITTAKCSHLDGRHVLFGRVTEGKDVVKKLEKAGSASGKPTKPLVIADCGEIEVAPVEEASGEAKPKAD